MAGTAIATTATLSPRANRGFDCRVVPENKEMISCASAGSRFAAPSLSHVATRGRGWVNEPPCRAASDRLRGREDVATIRDHFVISEAPALIAPDLGRPK